MGTRIDQAAVAGRVFGSVRRQADLASALGLRPATISAMKVRGRVSLEVVVAAAELTGRPVTWFLFGEEGRGSMVAEGEAISAVALESAKKNAKFIEELRIKQPAAGYNDEAAAAARMQILERQVDTLFSWMSVVEARLKELSERGR